MGKTWKRRNFFIKKDLQGKYIFSFFIFVVLGSVLYTAIFSMLSANTISIVYKDNNLMLGKTSSILFMEMLKANWILILSGGIIVVIISVFLTHRFAGPIYKFERTIDGMALGNLDFHVRLRKHDEGKDLAEAINRLKNTLASNIDTMRDLSDEIDRNLKAAAGADAEAPEELTSALKRASNTNGQLRRILDSYTTKND